MPKRRKGKYVRTTVSLPEDVWMELRVESIKRKKTMGDLIAEKLEELKKLKKRAVLGCD
ncbi:MAG: chromosome segregation protein SMC [Aquificota bacterium]|nr:chromosome segregation protein SMC [Aquificota bacterium]